MKRPSIYNQALCDSIKTAKEKIIGVVMRKMPHLSFDDASTISDQIISKIDWDDPDLMHKDLEWIASFFLKNMGFA